MFGPGRPYRTAPSETKAWGEDVTSSSTFGGMITAGDVTLRDARLHQPESPLAFRGQLEFTTINTLGAAPEKPH